jgi:hypothetical protein
MPKIKLPSGEWYYDANKPLGREGGFGQVFAGTAEGHGALAVKRIKLEAEDAAHRELRIADELAGTQFSHVIPIFDSGQDAESGSYFVIMSRAEKSLEDELNAGHTFSDSDAAKIMLQIALGLSEVSQIIHRDLKPGNVLYHDGKWKVADFGIARFVEESTSLRTLKDCLSPQYAAPEQWRFEHSTHATDVYALGCIGYALITGHPPFAGPMSEDFRKQHLSSEPPKLTAIDPQLQSLLLMMLRKPPEIRPPLDRVKHLLYEISDKQDGEPGQKGFDALARVGADIAERAAEEEARRLADKTRQENRNRIAPQATKILLSVAEHLFQRIEDAAPAAATVMKDADLWSLKLGQAMLIMKLPTESRALPEGAFRRSGWDVITGGLISVKQRQPAYTRSASLWYTNLGSDEQAYRWYEVSYFAPLSLSEPNVPFALRGIDEADEGIAGGGKYRVASGPYPIDDENVGEFCERWTEILTKACQGQLEPPRYLPLD